MKIQVNARNHAHYFATDPGENILYGGLSKSVDLPYECGSGTCGTCKARLISGELFDNWPNSPGRKYIKSADEFLMCQCSAVSDIVIEVPAFVHTIEVGTCTPDFLGGRIKAVSLLTHDVMAISIELWEPVDFDAGQFYLVHVPGVEGFRAWSMVNYQRHATTLDFVIKKKPEGALSDWLFSKSREGVEVEVFGPLGKATFHPDIAQNLLCIAGGSGIAGMMSILSRAAQCDYFTRYTGDVFFGVRSATDAFYLDEFASLCSQFPETLHITVALSEEEASASIVADYPQLRFEKGFVHEVAGRNMQGRYQDVRAYLAGPPPAVDASIRMLLQARVATNNIRYDKFS
ncbi:2Fe-2S iron-sulfur cluster-binding protein [Glaciimonas immobilis]|uniref:Toluene monooxygenase electron transfer component n=1 Tax=Glaciimonas immobilis TaxID=728004 RepID=A0A840RX48_9BURK|nr:2Fe-2S iron-sulfur cluster-binding protein [Glaciimonas immobilis]KAF3996517.1 2Fe-2S iron-sulfur cluster binding domain-containing protein [Glaciimonas immobilis]MBB5201121.1 toluene monooxygenase electron transfer component [Glaciimonas immobilis]